jgi:hypothetical protein
MLSVFDADVAASAVDVPRARSSCEINGLDARTTPAPPARYSKARLDSRRDSDGVESGESLMMETSVVFFLDTFRFAAVVG